MWGWELLANFEKTLFPRGDYSLVWEAQTVAKQLSKIIACNTVPALKEKNIAREYPQWEWVLSIVGHLHQRGNNWKIS